MLNLSENTVENLYKASHIIDNIGNVTLGLATIIGLVSIDIVLLVAILNQNNENRHRRDNDWELFWFSRWYSDRYYHHCCHYHPTRREVYHDEDHFIATTMITSLACTAIAIILALHFHLLTLALILASMWVAGFALKGLAYAIRPNFTEADAHLTEIPIATAYPAPSAPIYPWS